MHQGNWNDNLLLSWILIQCTLVLKKELVSVPLTKEEPQEMQMWHAPTQEFIFLETSHTPPGPWPEWRARHLSDAGISMSRRLHWYAASIDHMNPIQIQSHRSHFLASRMFKKLQFEESPMSHGCFDTAKDLCFNQAHLPYIPSPDSNALQIHRHPTSEPHVDGPCSRRVPEPSKLRHRLNGITVSLKKTQINVPRNNFIL